MFTYGIALYHFLQIESWRWRVHSTGVHHPHGWELRLIEVDFESSCKLTSPTHLTLSSDVSLLYILILMNLDDEECSLKCTDVHNPPGWEPCLTALWNTLHFTLLWTATINNENNNNSNKKNHLAGNYASRPFEIHFTLIFSSLNFELQ